MGRKGKKADYYDFYSKKGDFYFENGDYIKALSCYNKSLSEKKSDYLYFKLGLMYAVGEDYEKALEYLKKAYELKNNYVTLWIVGTVYSEIGDDEKALEYLKKAYELNSGSYELLTALGDKYEVNGEYENAICHYKKAYEISGKDEILVDIGCVYIYSDDYEKALEYLKKAYNPDSTDYRLIWSLGIAYLYSGDGENAIEYLKKAYEFKLDDYTILSQLGTAYFNTGDYKNALKYMEESKKLNPTNYEIFLTLGEIYLEIEDPDNALEYLKKAYEFKDNDKDKEYILENIVNVYIYKKDYKNALEYLKKAYELNNTNYKVIGRLGGVYLILDDYINSLEFFKKARTLNSEDYEICKFLGISYLCNKEYENALKYLEESKKLNPKNYTVYVSLGDLYLERKENENAIKNYSKSISFNKNVSAYVNRGIAYSNMGNFKNALEDGLNALKYFDDDQYSKRDRAVIYYNIAEYLIPDEKYAESWNYYKKALKIDFELVKKNQDEYSSIFAYIYENILNDKNEAECISIFGHLCKIIIRVKNFKKERLVEKGNLVHYTKPHVLELFIEKNSKFHLYDASYMNDPEEGKLLLDIAKHVKSPLKKFYPRKKESNEFRTFIGSFLPSECKDKLFLWRTYGKDKNGGEAKGACIEIEESFFDHEKHNVLNNLIMEQNIENGSFSGTKQSAVDKTPLNIYRVVYEKLNDEDGKIKSLLADINEDLTGLLKYTKFKKPIGILVRSIMDEVTYLVKSVNYKEEEEVRAIITYKIDNPHIQTDNNVSPPRLYVEIDKELKKYISSVVIGPRVENKGEWKVYLDYHKIPTKISDCKFK
ncbi:tetratricopeptide repeat protein [Methanococcus maripaludis]|uniref:Tetratricopeptide (TPR) repeat protein n=1 Tax=Methanococcus maripaludis TaxID=39152 RepID=A0A7J9SB76_METMI|nr:tetratricopeptide repeat protein [Methanococcus maripaludis]MBB6497313.1 tetratricopeptide (TPR) repeat protein [Methanococcus maripaludis]